MLELAKKEAGWTRVALGEVVRLSRERSRDPAADGFERFVGLEHIDPGSLRLRRWGHIADGTTFTNVFRPGQVLFGKRRAYQRKVAVASFSGVCSGDIYVLEPKGNQLLPGLLPFICQTDAFFEHAIGTSAGSLSPRTNWSSLAEFEFLLPPQEEQKKLVEALTAAREYIDSLDEVTSALEGTLESYLASMAVELTSDFGGRPLGEVADVKYGLTVNQKRRLSRSLRPYLRVANVARGKLDLREVKSVGLLPGDEQFELEHGDLVVVEGHANVNEIGRAAIWKCEIPGALHQNHLIRVRSGPSAKPEFLLSVLNSSYGKAYFRSRSKSSSGLNTINSTVVKEFLVPVPPRAKQMSVVQTYAELSDAIDLLAERHFNSTRVLSAMLRVLSKAD